MTTETIRSDVTGSVWKIMASPGDVIDPDGTLLILESMKMEIPVIAPDGGRLLEILVAEGDPVKEGQELALMDVA